MIINESWMKFVPVVFVLIYRSCSFSSSDQYNGRNAIKFVEFSMENWTKQNTFVCVDEATIETAKQYRRHRVVDCTLSKCVRWWNLPAKSFYSIETLSKEMRRAKDWHMAETLRGKQMGKIQILEFDGKVTWREERDGNRKKITKAEIEFQHNNEYQLFESGARTLCCQ